MKWLIASDLHGSAYYCRMLINAYMKERADRMLLLGDLLYHGSRNDLPKEYAPKAVIEMLNEYGSNIVCVRGNCESEVDQMVLDFPIMADYAVLNIEENIIFATHGHRFNEDNVPPLKKGDILLNGHTHIPAFRRHGDYIYMNPGSVSLPKESSHHGYMIFEGNVFQWKDLSGRIIMTESI